MSDWRMSDSAPLYALTIVIAVVAALIILALV